MPKKIAEHFNWENLIKAVLIFGGFTGVTSVTSSEPELVERLTVLETRQDPLMGAIEENTKQMRILIKSSDSLSIIVKMHIEQDKE